MTTEQKRAAHLAHEDRVDIVIDREPRPWVLTRWAKRLAEDEGVTVADQIESLSTASGLDDIERAVSNLLFVGFLPFVEPEEARDLIDCLSTQDIVRHVPTIKRALGAGEPSGNAEAADG